MTSLASLVTIILIPLGGTIPGLGECNQPYGGGYYSEISTAYICTQRFPEDTAIAKYHEVGHHLYENILTEKEKAEYGKLFDSHKKKSYNFYRPYGQINANESMAEDIMTMYMKIPPRVGQKQRINLIKKYLRNHNLSL